MKSQCVYCKKIAPVKSAVLINSLLADAELGEDVLEDVV